MKKIILALMAVVLLGSLAFAAGGLGVYQATPSTFSVAGAKGVLHNAADINVAEARIYKITITNSKADVYQDVIFYQYNASTASVTEKFRIQMATAPATTYIDTNWYFHEDYWNAAYPMVRKTDTASTVKVIYWYR